MAVRVCDYRTVFVSSVCLVKYTLGGTIVTSLLLRFITNLVDIDSLSVSYEVFRRKLVIVFAITRLEALSQARLIQPTCVGNKFGASLLPSNLTFPLIYIIYILSRYFEETCNGINGYICNKQSIVWEWKKV
jgi:hypothetical protein